MANEVLENLAFDPENGSIAYKDIRYLLIRPESVAAIYDLAEEQLGEAVREVFFQAVYRGVSLSMQAYAGHGAPTSGEEFVSFMTEMAGKIGWGKVSIASLDMDARQLVLEVKSSAWAYRRSGKQGPVCDPLRGSFAAIAEALWQTRVTTTEEKCAAMGDDVCRFVIVASD